MPAEYRLQALDLILKTNGLGNLTMQMLPRGTTTRFVVRYGSDEFPGLFMLHCHILQHEDGGMMSVVEVAR